MQCLERSLHIGGCKLEPVINKKYEQREHEHFYKICKYDTHLWRQLDYEHVDAGEYTQPESDIATEECQPSKAKFSDIHRPLDGKADLSCKG